MVGKLDIDDDAATDAKRNNRVMSHTICTPYALCVPGRSWELDLDQCLIPSFGGTITNTPYWPI